MNSVEIKEHLIAHIKEEMFKKNLTQEEVGKMVGRSRAYISAILQGKSSIEKLVTVLECLGLEITLMVLNNK
jgi:predicted XRE-type DNA-binding protein